MIRSNSVQHLLTSYTQMAGPWASLRSICHVRKNLARLFRQFSDLLHMRKTSTFTLFMLFSTCLISILPVALSNPLPTESRWDFSCKQMETATQVSEEIENTLFRKIVQECERAETHSSDAIRIFVEKTFKDDKFPESVSHLRQEWLPNLKLDKTQLTPEHVLLYSFSILQHFAIAMEQMIFDELFGDTALLDLFREEETYLYQLLNRVRLSVCIRRLQFKTVERSVMSNDYKQLAGNSKRNLRNFLILRDYAEAIKYIKSLFIGLLH